MKYELPKLNYAFDALEPHIDARTMEIHYTKHHQAYTDKLNGVLDKYPQLADKPLEELMRDLANSGMSADDQKVFRNHGGGYLNHNLFWSIIGPGKEIDQSLIEKITATFGSVDAFKEKFNAAATGQFGSGWAWLVQTDAGLQVYSTANQDSPYLQGHTPLIGLDVWEHAYYLKYQNKRADYIQAWWQVLKLV